MPPPRDPDAPDARAPDTGEDDLAQRPMVASQQVPLPRPTVFALVPRFEEVIQPEFMRLSGKVRVFVGLVMIAIDALGLYDASAVGFDTGVYRAFMAGNLPLLGSTVLLGWRSPPAAR